MIEALTLKGVPAVSASDSNAVAPAKPGGTAPQEGFDALMQAIFPELAQVLPAVPLESAGGVTRQTASPAPVEPGAAAAPEGRAPSSTPESVRPLEEALPPAPPAPEAAPTEPGHEEIRSVRPTPAREEAREERKEESPDFQAPSEPPRAVAAAPPFEHALQVEMRAHGTPPVEPALPAHAAAQPPRAVPKLPPANESSLLREAQLLARQGGGSARIVLEPPQLGSLGVRVSVAEARFELHLVAERSQVAELLAMHLPELRQALGAQGLHVDRADVEVRRDLGLDTPRDGADPRHAQGGVSAQDDFFPVQSGTLTFDGGTGTDGTTQFGGSSASGVTHFQRFLAQDGFTAGDLQSVNIDDSGFVTGSFSNGVTQSLAQVALARFPVLNGLTRVGDNNFAETPQSGASVIGSPNQGGYGSIRSGFLEQSNTDLANEFVKLILAQRAFQANTRTISTANELLANLVVLGQ